MRGSLRATGNLLVIDLGEVRRLITESGPRIARYVVVVRDGATGQAKRPLGPLLLRHGVPPGETLIYTTACDTLDFEIVDGAVVVGGVAVYPDGPPDLVFTPYYAWTAGE